MNKQEKISTVYNWLKQGYTVKGLSGGEMSIGGKYIYYSHFGNSSVTVSKKSVEFLITKIFNDTDFYIIDKGKMFCTDEMTAFYSNIVTDFEFINCDNENKLFEYNDTITNLLINMQDIAEKYAKLHTDDNVVRFEVKRIISDNADKDFIQHTRHFASWNFAI